jgi:transcriptional regulator with GAF, ATPase, and Fis domain
VSLLQENYGELERMVRENVVPMQDKLATPAIAGRAATPAAGLSRPSPEDFAGFQDLYCDSRGEPRWLEVARDLVSATDFHSALAGFSAHLAEIIPYDAVAVYQKFEDRLVPLYAAGPRSGSLGLRQVAMGEGISGWVAQKCKPLLNGNPVVEPAYSHFSGSPALVRSALAVPLEDVDGVVGVLVLYRADVDAFVTHELRLLLAIRSALSLCIQKALRPIPAETSPPIRVRAASPFGVRAN